MCTTVYLSTEKTRNPLFAHPLDSHRYTYLLTRCNYVSTYEYLLSVSCVVFYNRYTKIY
jgi:hypothetical protein